MPSKIDLRGLTFGRLSVLREASAVNERTRWECLCQCGTLKIIKTEALKRGATVSCGCQKRENVGKAAKARMTTHGQSKTPLYRVWNGMRERCRNPRHEKYPIYGGRGINVCDAWNSFEQFQRDMGPRPSPKHSLERKDSNGNYEPGNVCWATQLEQQNNRRDNLLITVRGVTKTCSQWAREFGIKATLLNQRITRDGKTPEIALGLSV